jgi:hypothetical protein
MVSSFVEFVPDDDDEAEDLEGELIELCLGDLVIAAGPFREGRARVSIPSMASGQLLLARCAGRYAVVPTALVTDDETMQISMLRAPQPGAEADIIARLSALADSRTNSPTGPSYPGLVSAHTVASNPALVAGWPAKGRLPVDRTPRRYRASYLATDLLTAGAWGAGELVDFEISWEPLGWSLDEWVRTDTIPPGADRAQSRADVSSNAGATSERDREAEERNLRYDLGDTATDQAMDLVAAQTSTSRGFAAGLGSERSRSSGVSLDPIFSLARAVTGTIQVGYSSSNANLNAQEVAKAQQRVRSEVEQSTRSLRSDAARSLGESSASLVDDRLLEAIRNPTERALNLALFTISRQWLVTTLVARKRPVVLIPIDAWEDAFDDQDIFVHRAVLEQVLLDSSLAPALNAVAASWGLDPAERPAARLKTVTVEAKFSDLPKGRDSGVDIDLHVRGSDQPIRWKMPRTELNAPEVRTTTVDMDIDALVLMAITFHNPGAVRDNLMTVDQVVVSGVDQDGKRHALLKSGPLDVPANGTHSIAFPRREPEQVDGSIPARRVRAHLDANRLHYRLAIDLARNPVDRFGLLERPTSERRDGLEPLDLNPVGIAGAHIAFVCGGEKDLEDREKSLTRDVLSTPAGGTWTEAMGSAHSAECQTISKPATWSSLPMKDGSYTWPALASAASAAAPGLDATAATSPPAAAAPAVTLVDLAARLDKLQANIEKLAKETATPPPTSAGGPNHKAGDGPGGDNDEKEDKDPTGGGSTPKTD